MSAYYNENDPFAAQWLRNLIKAGHIADGEVDEKSIVDVHGSDLDGFVQAHFFAGIGVWSHSLRLAGVSDDVPIWTGSCPCQPFSAAGQRKGTADDRHLWPVWFDLIRQCKPPVVFGEQVSSKDGLGWFDLVSTDLEGAGYAVGAADLCAASAGAPHIRQRLWFVAHRQRERLEVGGEQQAWRERATAERSGDVEFVADAVQSGRPEGRTQPRGGQVAGSFWSRAEWLHCTDGKARLAEPGVFPLAHGATQRMGRLRAYGNAICPQVAKAFIEVAMECAP
jgi:DNA (cytosine-5)-methyltransferase 1